MSPIKRGIEEREFLPLKRLRGGGDDFPDEEELFMDDIEEDQPEPPEEMEGDDEIVKEALKGTNTARWTRPPVPADFDNQADLNIHCIDIDIAVSAPLTKNPNESRRTLVGSDRCPKVPVLRAYGVNEAGNSVTMFIHGFTPYAYFALPAGYELTDDSRENLEKIRSELEHVLQSTVRSNQMADALVVGVKYVTGMKSIMGYETHHTKFLKVYVSLPGFVPTLKKIMGEGISLPGVSVTNPSLVDPSMMGSTAFAPFECNVPFVLRYMVDQDVVGAGWLTLPKKTYQIRSQSQKETHCQVSPYCVQFHVTSHSLFSFILCLGLPLRIDRSGYLLRRYHRP